MNDDAWEAVFDEEGLGAAPALDLPGRLTRSWAFGDGRGTGVRVAVVDSGVDDRHPAIGTVTGGVVIEPDAEANDRVRHTEGAHDDLYGHGTACAGIIRSLAPEVDLYSVRVLGRSLTGKGAVFAAGLQWCIEHGMQVVNLSLSTSNPAHVPRFQELSDRAAFGRILLVSAMDNLPRPSFPSQFSSVFSVAAARDQDRDRWFCNPAPPAEWGAAGVDVDVPWLDGTSIVASGNSFAAPVIAGHLARLVAEHPAVTPYQAKTVMAALAANAPATGMA